MQEYLCNDLSAVVCALANTIAHIATPTSRDAVPIVVIEGSKSGGYPVRVWIGTVSESTPKGERK